MGGRGSSFELASRNEDFLKLLNNYTNGVSVEFFENAKEKYILNLNKSIDVGFKASVPNNKKAYYTSVHELGHAVQHAMYKKETGNKYDGFEKYAEKMRGDIIKLAKDKYNTKTNVVSKYSTQNAPEWFAETFTSLMLNGALTPLTKAINEYMKNKGETNYGRNI